jgi:hypothetical protein
MPPNQLKPQAAAKVLEGSLDPKRRDFTIADAAAASGLSLHEAEQGLHALVAEHRGHLRVTEDGDILFRFPHGFDKPWVTVGMLGRAARAVGRAIEGAARFVVRAWVSIVLVGYALLFIALFLALAFGGRSDRGDSKGGAFIYPVLRLVGDALFWTFHPFSPFNVGDIYAHGHRQRQRRSPKLEKAIPFYERVDRFFFGPKEQPADPRALERALTAEIRAGKGRIGLADVMRITGKPRSETDPLMSQLLMDYGGSV